MRFCPYLGKETDETFNKEHVIPDALGGADKFCIEVCESMNSKGRDLIENGFVHDYSMQRPKTECNVISRSGQTPQYKVEGEFYDGTKVRIAIDAVGEQTLIPVKPVEKVETENHDGSKTLEVTILMHESDPNLKNLEGVEAGIAKRGEITKREESELGGSIRAETEINRTALLRGSSKIAFAACCFKFPEWARCSVAAEFRTLFEDSWDPTEGRWGVKWQFLQKGDPKHVLFPEVGGCQHVVVLYGSGDGKLLCGVKLFGGEVVAEGDQKTAIFEMHDAPQSFLGDASRWYARVDATSKRVEFVEDVLARPT